MRTLLALLVFLAASSASADRIILKTGEVLRVGPTWVRGGQVWYASTPSTNIGIPQEEVRRVLTDQEAAADDLKAAEQRAAMKPPAPLATPASPPIANAAHNGLMALSQTDRVLVLAKLVSGSDYRFGSRCIGRSLEHKATDGTGRAFWRVDCSDGKSYMVQIFPDAEGSTTIVPCSLMFAVRADCFKAW